MDVKVIDAVFVDVGVDVLETASLPATSSASVTNPARSIVTGLNVARRETRSSTFRKQVAYGKLKMSFFNIEHKLLHVKSI